MTSLHVDFHEVHAQSMAFWTEHLYGIQRKYEKLFSDRLYGCYRRTEGRSFCFVNI